MKNMWVKGLGVATLFTFIPLAQAQDEESPERRLPPGRGEHRPPPPGQERGEHMPPPQEVTEKDKEEFYKFLKEVDPAILEHLKKMEEDHPEAFRGMLQHGVQEMRHLKHLKKENPEEYQRVLKMKKQEAKMHLMMEKVQQLLQKYREAGDNKETQADLKGQIKEALQKVLQAQADMRKRMIEETERHIQKIKEEQQKAREELKEWESDPDKVVEKRLKELLEKRPPHKDERRPPDREKRHHEDDRRDHEKEEQKDGE